MSKQGEFIANPSNAIIKKSKSVCGIFITFFESKLNLEHFQKNNEPHSLCISEIIDSERCGYLNA